MIRKAKNTGGEKAEKKFSRTMSNDNLPKSSSVSNMIDTWHDSWSLQSEWWCLKDSIESTSGICDKQQKCYGYLQSDALHEVMQGFQHDDG